MYKKIVFIGLLFIVVVFIVSIFLPSIPSSNITIATNTSAFTRNILLASQREKWNHPKANQVKIDTAFSNNPNIITASLLVNNTVILLNITLVQFTKDSILASWNINNAATGFNPFLKIVNYYRSKKIMLQVAAISMQYKQYLQSRELYGFKAAIATLQDSTLLTLKDSTIQQPTITQVYSRIYQLQQYATTNNAVATNAPMFTIQKNNGTYYWMVGLPISKRLPPYKNIVPKMMLKNGFFIKTDTIYGGINTIDSLFKNFELYKNDYKFSSPAIPFQSLVTKRNKELDSTKWITLFYYPIF